MFSESPLTGASPLNNSGSGAAGGVGISPHLPVMAGEVTDFFTGGRREGLLVDGTAGAGGHLSMLLSALPEMSFLAVDRDPAAVAILMDRFRDDPRVTLSHASYTGIPRILEEIRPMAAGALFDLGLSSLQLDDPSRGFSYRSDGPLDMRFDSSEGDTAAELVNGLPEKELADIIYRFGQEGRSRRISGAIVKNRPVKSSRELAEIIEGAVRGRPVKILSRVFQALRIAVNREMEQLDSLLEGLHRWTEPGARIAFITFHSIEDRKVKLLFRDDPAYRQHSPRWLVPGEEELAENGRARSARLRMGIRT